MEITNTTEGDIHFIAINGDLDASSSILLDKAIKDALSNNIKIIIVDCINLNYISSAGLGVFMSYIEEFENNGTQLVIFGLTEKVKNVFKILGLDQLLNIVKTKEEAKAFVHGA